MNPLDANLAVMQEKPTASVPTEDEGSCTMLFVQTVVRRQRYRSFLKTIDQSIAANAIRTTGNPRAIGFFTVVFPELVNKALENSPGLFVW